MGNVLRNNLIKAYRTLGRHKDDDYTVLVNFVFVICAEPNLGGEVIFCLSVVQHSLL